MKDLLKFVLLAAVMLATRHALAEPVIVELRTAAPTVLVAVVLGNPQEEDGYSSVADTLDLDLARWRVNGAAPAAIHRYSMPFEEQRNNAATGKFPVTVQHRIYLRLNQPLQENGSYEVSSPYGTASMTFSSASTLCESIKVNQVGYSARATSRYANYGVFMGDGGSLQFAALPSYQVVRESGGTVVHAGLARYMGDDTYTGQENDPNLRRIVSGEHVYRLSLNDVPAGGLYHVRVPGCGRSRAFGIGERYTHEAAWVVTRGLYHQRCGTALTRPYTDFTRAICHPLIAHTRSEPDTDEGVPVPPHLPTFPMSGGYHDAGNFQRLFEHMEIPQLLLGYIESFPGNFVDNQYNIPESGNGIPDLLDEALWGVKVWENLQIDDPADAQHGGVMAGTVEQPHFMGLYGYGNAANNPQLEGTWPVTEKASATAAGLFAHASRLIRPYDPARADALLLRARRAWAYVARTSNLAEPTAHFLYGALHLYLATGEGAYHDVFKTSVQGVFITAKWPETYAPGNFSSTIRTAAVFISYLLPGGPDRDPQVAAILRDKIFYHADTETYMGPHPENDPYPQGVTKFMGWGTGTTQGRYADVYVFAWLLTPDPVKKQHYLNAVSQFSDFSLGLNPMGISFYTGLGWEQPNSPLHLDSWFTKYGESDGVTSEHVHAPIGNVPGYLIMGPVGGGSGQAYQTAVSNKVYPPFDTHMPPLRRFAHGWSLINVNEGGSLNIAWNAVMLGFLHNSAGNGGTPCTAPKPLLESQPGACPAGQVGAIMHRRDHVCVGGAWTPSVWQAVDNSCSVPCPGTQPADETHYGACPAGQVGSKTDTRSYSCKAGAWTAGEWKTVSSTCATAPPPAPECIVDPVTNSVTVSGLSVLACVQRGDTGAVRHVLNQGAVFPGAPSADFTVSASDQFGPDGKCANAVYSAQCTVPKANPQCVISPWDGAVKVSGLADPIACVGRSDTGQVALPSGGTLSFAGPAADGLSISAFSRANADGTCSNLIGQYACAVVPAPAPVCTVQPNGSVLVGGLNASIPCVGRTDTGETKAVANGQALFAGTAAASGLQVRLFADGSADGTSCSGQVGTVACTPPPADTCTGTRPADDWRHLACAPGLVGHLRQERTFSCVAGAWTGGDWTFAANNCSPPPQGDPACTVDPAADTITLTSLTSQRCVKRSDTNAIAYPGGATAILRGAPAHDIDVLAYDDIGPDGECTRFSRVARCAVPVAAQPQCIVSPWDNSVQVSGLGTELPCVVRVDNGKMGLADRGRLSFAGPTPAATSILTFGAVNTAGTCIGQKGLLGCESVPKPAPSCTRQADGSALITGLNESTPCVVRSDTGEIALTANGQVSFASGATDSSKFVYFTNVHGNGSCAGPVGALTCPPPPPPPSQCDGEKPADDWRLLACAPGQTGHLKQTRVHTCNAQTRAWTPGDWMFESNNCSVPADNPICSVDPLTDSVSVTNLSTLKCVKRSDSNAIGLAADGKVVFPGAPSKDFEIYAYDELGADGQCQRFSRYARCIVPVPAKPQCIVSPWDGSLQVSGLGTELACVTRADTGQVGLADRGRLSFSAPAGLDPAVNTFREVSQAGSCVNPAGQLACPAVPKPAPSCRVQANGSLLVAGLNESTPCVSRNDTGEQRFAENGEALFAGAPASPDMRVYIYSNINTYGACIGHVAAVPCQADP